jgi:hypothetical protein
VLPDAGHDPDESPLCFEKAASAFLAGVLPRGELDCQSFLKISD